MAGSLNFWNLEVWDFIVLLSILFASLMAANVLLRVIRPLRRALVPSSVLAGFLLLIADSIYKHLAGTSMFASSKLEIITYHGLGLGFVAITLKSAEKSHGREARRDIFNTGLTVVSSYLLQAVAGLAITIALYYLIGSWAASGILLPMGFGQGPGQAYNWGLIYETATNYPPFENGTSFGLTVAAAGFISASIGGIFYLNRMRRQGNPKAMIKDAESIENLSAEMVTQKGEIPLLESMDKLTVQFALVFICYGVACAFMRAVSVPLDRLGGFFAGTVKPLIWGFNFLVGTVIAILVKTVLKVLGKKGIVQRRYTNDFMLTRISGVMFDLMVTASIAAIDLSAFKNPAFILPLTLTCIAGTVFTYWYNDFVCKRLFPGYTDEAFLSLYGMLTGTASTGMILLREVDPLFQTPAAGNLIYQNVWAILFGFPMLMLMGVVAIDMTWTLATLGILVVLLAAMMALLFRAQIRRRIKKK